MENNSADVVFGLPIGMHGVGGYSLFSIGLAVFFHSDGISPCGV